MDLAPPTSTAGPPATQGWFTSDVVRELDLSREPTTCQRRLPPPDADRRHRPAPRSPAPCRHPESSISRTAPTVLIYRTPPTAVVATPARPPDAGPLHGGGVADQFGGDGRHLRHRRVHLTLTDCWPPRRALTPLRLAPAAIRPNVSAPLPFSFTYGTPPTACPDRRRGSSPSTPATPSTGGPAATSTTTNARPQSQGQGQRLILDLARPTQGQVLQPAALPQRPE